MAYPVSNEFRQKCYSGESDYDLDLKINDVTIPLEQVEKIEISNPIIDSTNESMYVGTFIAQVLKITFVNLDGLDIKSDDVVKLRIGQYIDSTSSYEYCPIGEYIVDISNENYDKMNTITCYDYSVKFKQNMDYSSCFTNHGTEEEPIMYATIDEILQELCDLAGVELGTYPTTNGDIEIGTYDNTISGKQWVSYIAEIKGCNAKIGRDGKLNLIPLKKSSSITIDALESKSWELGEKYEISQVIHPTRGFIYPIGGDESANTLYIRQDNPFIKDTITVSNIYDVVVGTIIYNVKCENLGDVSLDAWDYITYNLDENISYDTLNNNNMTFDMTCMSTVETKIPTKQQEQTTNYVGGDQETFRKVIKQEFDLINASTTILASKVENIEQNGVTEVTTTTGFTFNADGLLIAQQQQQGGTIEYGYSTQIKANGTYYQYGDPNNNPQILGQYTKDGSKQKDLELFGQYKYGKDSIDDDPMFITELFVDSNNEECFGHFYAGN